MKALLNNLLPRLEHYASWLGRRAAVWHGDVTASARQRILREPPDLLLTTPESLEAMLISLRVEHARMFSDLRAIVVDEVHAFAGDDRGWHLLAVLERLSRVTERSIQRIGLSATVGNPGELLDWLQGTGRGQRPAVVVAPAIAPAVVPVQADAGGTDAAGETAQSGGGRRAGLCGLGQQRRDRDRHPAPRRKAPGLLRLPAAGRGNRDSAARARRDHVPVPCVPVDRRTPPRRAGVRRGPGLRHRGHLHPGTRDRRR